MLKPSVFAFKLLLDKVSMTVIKLIHTLRFLFVVVNELAVLNVLLRSDCSGVG